MKSLPISARLWLPPLVVAGMLLLVEGWSVLHTRADIDQARTDMAAQQNAALVEQSAAAADSLRDESHRLSDAVHKFRIEGEVRA